MSGGAPRPSKEAKIAQLLAQAKIPGDLVGQGYARGTVYKVARRLRGGTPPGRTGTAPQARDMAEVDPSVEADEEIRELKKRLRKAQLEQQIAELRAPLELETRMKALEDKVGTFDEWAEAGDTELAAVQHKLGGTPMAGLRDRFKCSCGANGLVVVQVACTACGTEKRYGWWPSSAPGNLNESRNLHCLSACGPLVVPRRFAGPDLRGR